MIKSLSYGNANITKAYLNNEVVYRKNPFTPLELFRGGVEGVWLDPSDMSTMFQDVNREIPVKSPGDPVGLILDKSRGLEWGANIVTNGTFTQGLEGWSTGADTTLYANANSITVEAGVIRSNHAARSLYFPLVVGGIYEISYEILSLNAAASSAGIIIADLRLLSNNLHYSYPGKAGLHKVLVKAINKTGNISLHAGISEGSIAEFANVSIKLLKGNHAYQPLSTSRPTYKTTDNRDIINQLLYSDNLTDPVWSRSNSNVEKDVTTPPPFEGVSVYKVTSTRLTSGSVHISQGVNKFPAPITFTSSVYLKAGSYTHARLSASNVANAAHSVTINLSNGNYTSKLSVTDSVEVISLPNGWYRVSVLLTSSPYTRNGFALFLTSYASSADAGASSEGSTPREGEFIYVSSPQLELFPEGTNPQVTPYQKVLKDLGGVAIGRPTDSYFLEFDGVDDNLTFSNLLIDFNTYRWYLALQALGRGVLMESHNTTISSYSGNSSAIGDGFYFGVRLPGSVRNHFVNYTYGTKAILSQYRTSSTLELSVNGNDKVSLPLTTTIAAADYMNLGMRLGGSFATNCKIYSLIIAPTSRCSRIVQQYNHKAIGLSYE